MTATLVRPLIDDINERLLEPDLSKSVAKITDRLEKTDEPAVVYYSHAKLSTIRDLPRHLHQEFVEAVAGRLRAQGCNVVGPEDKVVRGQRGYCITVTAPCNSVIADLTALVNPNDTVIELTPDFDWLYERGAVTEMQQQEALNTFMASMNAGWLLRDFITSIWEGRVIGYQLVFNRR